MPDLSLIDTFSGVDNVCSELHLCASDDKAMQYGWFAIGGKVGKRNTSNQNPEIVEIENC
jgi:hypothetical protein